jgi:hypothetical protein
MLYAGLFDWWIATISWSIAFPIVVSIYLYRHRVHPQPASPKKQSRFHVIEDFTFVWFLLGLLAFYVVAVSQASYTFFALGNVAVEILLIIYVLVASHRGD